MSLPPASETARGKRVGIVQMRRNSPAAVTLWLKQSVVHLLGPFQFTAKSSLSFSVGHGSHSSNFPRPIPYVSNGRGSKFPPNEHLSPGPSGFSFAAAVVGFTAFPIVGIISARIGTPVSEMEAR